MGGGVACTNMTGRRWIRLPFVAVTASISACVIVISPAGASSVPTISGPGMTVKYNETVNLTGTTPEPNEQAVIYVKDPTMSSYLVLARPVSGSDGRFVASYIAQKTESLYVTAGGVASATITVPIYTPSCSVSATALSSPIPPITLPSSVDLMAFSAHRGQVWAGIAERDGLFETVVWRPGVPVRVLGSDDLSSLGYNDGGTYTVWVAGITLHGYVVSTQPLPELGGGERGYVWINYVPHQVAGSSNWTSVTLSGVSDSGTIIGTVQTGTTQATRRWAVVAWTEDGRHYMVIKQNMVSPGAPLIDGAGDVEYQNDDGTAVVRVGTTGQTITLVGDSQHPGPLGVSVGAAGPGSTFYGVLWNAVVSSWTIPPSSGGGQLAATDLTPPSAYSDVYVLQAGPRGDVLFREITSAGGYADHLLTADDALVAPPQTFPETDRAFDGNGTLAYTGIGGRVRFFSCT